MNNETRIQKTVLAIVFLLIQSYTVLSETSVSTCQSLDTVNTGYYLTQDVSNVSSCFFITADNVTLDCKGYSIFYANYSSGNGINIANNNETITNCNIKMANTSHTYGSNVGISLSGSSNSLITNNTIQTNGTSSDYGVFLSSSSNNTICNNSIHALGELNDYGFYLDTSNNNSIYNNSVKTFSSSDYAVFSINGGSKNTIYNNIFNVSVYSSSYVASLLFLVIGRNNVSVTPYSATNIIGGSQIGGNYYADSVSPSNSYSLTCRNADYDSFCDDSLAFPNLGNMDFYPLSSYYTLPIFTLANQSNSSLKKWQSLGINFNLSTSVNNLDTLTIETNTSGTFTNSTYSLSGQNFNITVNITVLQGNTTLFCIKPYFNLSLGYVNNTLPYQCFNAINSPPVANEVKINNTPLTTNAANGSASYSDIDNNTITAVGIQWFKDGQRIVTADDQTTLAANNYSADAQLIVSFRYSDGQWGDWKNSSVVIIGDIVPPALFYYLTYSNLNNLAGNTNPFIVNGSDLKSDIASINFSLNRSDDLVVDRSFTLSSVSRSVNETYIIFSSNEALNLGNYNISNIRVCEVSGNCNSTTDALSFPGWAGLSFTVSSAPNAGSPGGGGSSGCDAGFANVNGTCVPVTNLTKAASCGDSVCDALSGESWLNCPDDCPFKSGSLFSWLEGENQLAYVYVGLTVVAILFLSYRDKIKKAFGGVKGRFGR